MKKLMCAVAAVAAGVAMADGITSANVVGYQSKETVEGFNFVIPTFNAVGGGTVDIQDIKLNRDTATSWEDNIQILDEGGATIEIYTYATTDESGLEADGWVNGDASALVTRSLTAGQSVLVNTAAPTTITFSGEVAKSDTDVTSVEGFNFVGNASPVAIDIQDIKLDRDTATSWEDNIQILDEGGATIEIYTYATTDESGLEADGWVNGDASALVTRELEPGLGVLVNTANAGTTITLPAALE